MRASDRLLWPLVLSMLLLLGLGIAAIAATDPSAAGTPFARTHLGKQVIAALAGMVAFGVLYRFSYLRLRVPAYAGYGLLLVALVLVLKFAPEKNGSRRWFEVFGFGVQPSEYMKIAVILAIARYLHVREPAVRLRDIGIPLALVLAPMGLILKQPDLGTALVFFPIFAAMVFAAGAKKRRIGGLCLCAFALAAAPFVAYFTTGRVLPPLREYQMNRLTAFIRPENAPLGDGFQLLRALEAIRAGGWTGRGTEDAASGFTRFVPERHNDFIFSVVGESWGLLGTSSLLLLYAILLGTSLSIAYRCREPFGRLAIVGVVVWFAVQVFVNVAMTTGLAPITGMTLPLVSYGGSSLLTSCAALGVVAGIARRYVPVFSHDETEMEQGRIPRLAARARGRGDLVQRQSHQPVDTERTGR
ncbi:MAG: rod shape-determining protein RodA [Planctomycetota bacterium]